MEQRKAVAVGVLVIALFLILGGRLFILQVVRGESFKVLAKNVRTRDIFLPAVRGRILDAENIPVADNKPAFNVYVFPTLAISDTVRKLCYLLNVDFEEVMLKIEKRRYSFWPVLVARDVEKEKALEIESQWFPGVFIYPTGKRIYPFGPSSAPVVGYVGRAYNNNGRRMLAGGTSDLEGKQGVEKSYDYYLQGKPGVREVEIDAYGAISKILREIPPERGADVYLTVYMRLQDYIYKIFDVSRIKGVAIVMNPDTGEVYALVSYPSYDPNKLYKGLTPEEWRQILESEDHPLINKAIMALYPPGSAFKLVTFIAALQEGKVTLKDRFFCAGQIKIGDRVFKCWNERGHGWEDIVGALRDSCNVSFYQIGIATGVDLISKWAKTFRLDKRTGIDLPGELAGFVPTRKWKEKKKKEPWYLGDTANLSIGQGYVLVTPMELAVFVASIANGGKILKPYVVKKVVGPEGRVLYEARSEVVSRYELKDEVWDALRRGMKLVVLEGTGKRAAMRDWKVAGKTGTAQIPNGPPHAWFVGYAPADNPKFVVVVMVENGVWGGLVAAPLARQILEAAKRIIIEGTNPLPPEPVRIPKEEG